MIVRRHLKDKKHRKPGQPYRRSKSAKERDRAVQALPLEARRALEGKPVHVCVKHGHSRQTGQAGHRVLTLVKMHPSGTKFLAQNCHGRLGDVEWSQILLRDKRQLLQEHPRASVEKVERPVPSQSSDPRFGQSLPGASSNAASGKPAGTRRNNEGRAKRPDAAPEGIASRK